MSKCFPVMLHILSYGPWGSVLDLYYHCFHIMILQTMVKSLRGITGKNRTGRGC